MTYDNAKITLGGVDFTPISFSFKRKDPEPEPKPLKGFSCEGSLTIDGADARRFLQALQPPRPAGASDQTLAVRATYNNRKGRSARRRFARRGLRLVWFVASGVHTLRLLPKVQP